MINLFQPDAGERELAAIAEVLSSNWLGAGERVAHFERAFAGYIGCDPSEVLAVSSCTEGLFHSVAALGLSPEDEVIMPTISFIGAAHAVLNSGARIVLCDVDPVTLNPTVEHLERCVTPATRAALILHYGGAPGDVAAIAALAGEHSFTLVEDAAVGLGARERGRSCGTFGDVGVWSFDSMKTLTTGDGGMVRCTGERTLARIRASVRLGVGSAGFDRRLRSSRWWELDPPVIGRRAIMNDIAAATGIVQLARLPGFLSRRSEIAAQYDRAISALGWLTAAERPPEETRTFYWVQTEPPLRDRLASHMLERGIYTNFQYWPLHLTSLYRDAGAFPGAQRASERTLLLPLHQGLSDEELARVLDAIAAFVP